LNKINIILLVSLIVIATTGLFFVPNLILPFGNDSNAANIFYSIRLPGMLTAIFCGAALSVSGFVLQQLFKNNLAGPYILGVSSGASLAVAILIISAGFFNVEAYGVSIPLAGFTGAFAILLLIMLVSARFGYGAIILLFGVIIGQLSGALQSLLSYIANPGDLKLFTLWSMGSFGNVIETDLIILIVTSIIGIFWCFLLMPSLSVMVLGDDVARSLGVNTSRLSLQLLICTGLLTGMATAYCGPIAFIGMAVPNVSRILVKTANFKVLLISNALLGALMAVISQNVSNIGIFSINIPVNVTTALIGGPIILHILLRNRH
jgi:iron complex transport system permease protein